MIQDVGAGTPWTALWFICTVFLLGVTVVGGVIVVVVSRMLKKKDDSDHAQNIASRR